MKFIFLLVSVLLALTQSELRVSAFNSNVYRLEPIKIVEEPAIGKSSFNN